MKDSGCMPSVSATTRSASAPENFGLQGWPYDNFNRKPCATQSVAQGFPSRLHADRMSLQDPARHSLLGWRGSSNPKRTYSIDQALGLFPRLERLAQVE